MKKTCLLIYFRFLMLLSVTEIFSQTMTELVVPKYFGSKSAAAANTGRTPIANLFKNLTD